MSEHKTIACRQCGSEMDKTRRTQRNTGLQVLGVFVALAGLVILIAAVPSAISAAAVMHESGSDASVGIFASSVFGGLLGLALLVAGCQMGYKQQKIWRCRECGYFFERE